MADQDFADILNTESGKAERPKPYPAGTYEGVVEGYKLDRSREKKTPYVEFQIKVTGWKEDVDEEDAAEVIDMSKPRTFRDTYYLTEDAKWRFEEALDKMGIQHAGKTYSASLEETRGRPVVFVLTQQPSNRGDGMVYNNIERLIAIDED